MVLNADTEGVCQEVVLAKGMSLQSENSLIVRHLVLLHQ